MKFFKYILYLLIAVFLLITPIYALSKIFLPQWLVSNISKNLPPGSKLNIGSISSKNNLGIEYERIIYEAPNQLFTVNISSIHIKPRLSINAPLILTAKDFKFYDKNSSLIFKNLTSKLVVEDILKKEVSLSGNLESLSSNQKATFFDINFLFKGLNSEKKLLFIDTEIAELNVKSDMGPLIFKAKNSSYSIEFSNELKVGLKAKEAIFDMSQMINGNEGRVLFVDEFFGELNLQKDKKWKMPLEFNLVNPRATYGPISSKVIIKSRALWKEKSKNCTLNEIVLLAPNCGNITDFVDINFSLFNKSGVLRFFGDGYCVTPNADCLQEIQANISTKNTTDVFSDIMASGIINPLIGGIILGSLISSPSKNSSEYDHEIKLEVKGSSIKINGKPLI